MLSITRQKPFNQLYITNKMVLKVGVPCGSAYKTRLAYSFTLNDVYKEAIREAYESNPEKKKKVARKAYNTNSKYK